MTKKFTGSFTQQASIPESAISAAISVLESGRLHRYNVAEGEVSDTAALEQEYAQWQGAKYCLALASGGQALQISMRAAGVQPGDKVLTNAFTLAPVPGAIHAVGGVPVLVEINDNLVIDLADLEQKARASGARYFLLSHMRGHLADMEQIVAIAQRCGLTMIEDCAHTMGASWGGVKSGNFGISGCFSTQTYKHINSGEGGLITSDDPFFMAQATILSGSYMLYERHGARPALEYFDSARLTMPNMSARMDNLRAAILRPQLARLNQDIQAWNLRYHTVAQILQSLNMPSLLPVRDERGLFVGSSIQFKLPTISAEDAQTLMQSLLQRGVEIKWFGAVMPVGFTSSHHNWQYIAPSKLPVSDQIMAGLFDMRLPLTFSLQDCTLVAEILVEEISKII